MTAFRCNPRFLGLFILGIIVGSVGTLCCCKAVNIPPKIRISGMAVLDSATHQNAYLHNAKYLENPTLTGGRIYLSFQDDATMNAAIGKMVALTGHLRTVDIGDGRRVTELTVVNVEYEEK